MREQYRKELEQLKKEIERIKAASGSDPPTEEKTPYFEIATAIVASFNSVSSGLKRISSLPTHVKKGLARQVKDFDEIYAELINDLLKQNLLKSTKVSYKITSLWTEDITSAFCQNQKK